MGWSERTDSELMMAVRSGDDAAWEAFVRRWADLLYGCCLQVFSQTECTDEFPRLMQRLRADRLAVLSDWDDRIRLAGFLALKAADLLASRITSLLASDRERGWMAFERFFSADLVRIVRRRMAAEDMPTGDTDDVVQDLRLRLMADGGSVLRRYDGRGSFTGYVRRVCHNLVEDIIRARDGRRREPEAIRRLGDLERQAFHLVHVQGYRADQLPEMLRDQDGRRLSRADALRILARAEEAIEHRPPLGQPRAIPLTMTGADGEERERPLPVTAPSPEESLAGEQDRRALERACEGLATAMARLPHEARLYLQLRFLEDPPMPPRRIAERLGLPVEELYRRRKTWEAQLRAELRIEGVENFPVTSV